jgi:uncharacterized integral membrane protein
MRVTFWIVGVPLLLVGAFFAVANRELVSVDLWPLTGQIRLPLFAALVGALYLGFILGAAVAWWAGRGARGRGRDARRRLAVLAEENAKLQAQLAAAKPPDGNPPPALIGPR